MTSTQVGAAGTEIRPFEVDVPQADLDELRRRIQATRWPEQETVADVDEGNHFAAWQVPDIFMTEVRAGFRSLRQEGSTS